MQSRASNNSTGQQLSLFNLPRTTYMGQSPKGGMKLLAELNEISERPKGLGQEKYRRDIKDD